MCHWIVQNGGGVRRWRPEASTCGPDMTYSGAKSRSGPQMFLNKGQTEKIKQQLPVREACRGVGLFARAVGEGDVRGRGEIGNCYRLVPERRQGAAGQALFAWTGAALSPPANDEGAGPANDGKVKADE